MIPTWLFPFTSCLEIKTPFPDRKTVLDFQTYPGLEILQKAGATINQLQKCQIGFELFKECEQYEFKDYTNELTDGCVKILETKKAVPQHFSVFFGTAAYLIRHDRLKTKEILALADFQAGLIKNNQDPAQVQKATWQNYVANK